MAKLNEHNLDSIRRRYNQQNRELVLENAALRRQKRVLEQQVNHLKEYVFELWRRIDCPMHFVVEELNLPDPATDIRCLIGREMENDEATTLKTSAYTASELSSPSLMSICQSPQPKNMNEEL